MTDPYRWMSTEDIEAHGRRWAGLPELPRISKSLTDYDAEAHGDLLYISGLIDDLLGAKVSLEKEMKAGRDDYGRWPAEPLMWLQFLTHSAEAWTSRTLHFTEPWPEDKAAALLEAWRGQQEAAA